MNYVDDYINMAISVPATDTPGNSIRHIIFGRNNPIDLYVYIKGAEAWDQNAYIQCDIMPEARRKYGFRFPVTCLDLVGKYSYRPVVCKGQGCFTNVLLFDWFNLLRTSDTPKFQFAYDIILQLFEILTAFFYFECEIKNKEYTAFRWLDNSLLFTTKIQFNLRIRNTCYE